MAAHPFNSHLVLTEQIHEATLRAFIVGFEENKFRLKQLADVILEVVPEFALGWYRGSSLPIQNVRSQIREAARRVYQTDAYKGRGEFGELILHLLLRDYCDTVPLVSKIYFKDSPNFAVHGFDAVHVVNGDNPKLWLGESKIYLVGSDGVRDLASDIKNHFQADYLRKEFSLISPKLPDSYPDIENWRDLLHENRTLESIFSRICVPVVCTYQSKIYKSYKDATAEFVADLVIEFRNLETKFRSHISRTDLDIILLLLPIEAKADLVRELHEGLVRMQAL